MRTESKRHDELGDLGRDFDLMADRIETLLTSERRLLQDVSHELRTPLARLVLAVELMRPEEAKQEVARLSSLIGELVDMTRAEGGMVKVDRRNRRRLGAARGDGRADTRLSLAADKHLVCHGHAALLRRALDNVLQNAVRYSPEGNPPTLSATCKDGLRGDLRSRLWTWRSGRGTRSTCSVRFIARSRTTQMELGWGWR